ncbi:MAG: AcrR family transcriptional regulator [Zhongshania sp.]|jgi:AcrR family transcriptional regulator
MTTNKDKILQAATTLLLEKGLAGMSVRAIANLAGVSTIGIYTHFHGKQGILDALYIEGYQYVGEAMLTAVKIDDPRAAAIEGARLYLEVAKSHEAIYRLIFGEVDFDYEPGKEARAAALEAFGYLVNIGARLLPASASLTEKQSIALRIWALVHGYVSLQHHAVRDVVVIDDWNRQALAAVVIMIDNIAAEH